MGRTRTFDRDTVLFAAANLFRQRGYRDVSIAELEKATGLVSGSIYNAFGDKAGLFRAALDHYVHGFVQQRLEDFAGGHARLEDNSIIEFGRGGEMASEGVAEALKLVREGVGGVLARELGAEAAATETVRLLVLYHGILALSRSLTPFGEMADAVRAEFTRLRELRDRMVAAPTDDN